MWLRLRLRPWHGRWPWMCNVGLFVAREALEGGRGGLKGGEGGLAGTTNGTRRNQHSPGTPTTGILECGNNTTGAQAAAADKTQRPDTARSCRHIRGPNSISVFERSGSLERFGSLESKL